MSYIYGKWQAPTESQVSPKYRVKIELTVLASGRISYKRITHKSGISRLDRSVVDLLPRLLNCGRPLPKELGSKRTFVFDLSTGKRLN